MAAINGNDFLNFLSSTDGGGDILDNGGDDYIVGTDNNDLINGGAGADTMVGGLGHDTYYVDNVNDKVIEYPNEGEYDGILASVSFSLFSAPNVETLILANWSDALGGVGNELDNVIYGNSRDNSLAGNDGNDTINGLVGNDDLEGGSGDDSLDGAAGDDRMSGNIGNDTYFVNSVGDEVTELANNGVDTVKASIDYTLGEHLENLTLLDKASVDGPDTILHVNATGNELDNTITGNIWNNVLDGKAGSDTLIGGLGDDTYIVDAADSIVEKENEGVDTVVATSTYLLGDNLENLTLTGTESAIGTGNTLNNTLRGNAGINILNGKEGDDTLIGGLGNDIYAVNDAGDQVIEGANEGLDIIVASVSYTLSNNVERMGLMGTENLNATGNAFDNILLGNAGVNMIEGAAGNDILIGAGGRDTLKGGTGADKFVFTALTDRVDRILDFSQQDQDKILFISDGFRALYPGSVEEQQFVLGKKAQDKTDRLIYNQKNGALFYDADGKGGVGQVKIATFANKPALSASDFVVGDAPVTIF